MATTDTDARSNGVMVAFKIPKDMAQKLVLPGGDPVEQLHMTLGYFGKEEELSTAEKNSLRNMTRRLAKLLEDFELNGVVSGLGYFQNKGATIECLYSSVDVPGLSSVYEWLLRESLRKDLPLRREHAFNPHITLRYQSVDTPRPRRKTPLPAVSLGPSNLVCKIGEEVCTYTPGENLVCPACGFEDCQCTLLMSPKGRFRSYTDNTRDSSLPDGN